MVDGGQGEYVRVPLADGTLVATREVPDESLVPSLLTLSDVMGTGWHAAVAAGVREGDTVVVVGDGAVGLCGVLAAARMGAERVVAMSRHESRQRIAEGFGATDIVATRGEEGEAEVLALTDGVGADAVLECVGTGEAMTTAIAVAGPARRWATSASRTGWSSRSVTCSPATSGWPAALPRPPVPPRLRDDVLAGAINPGVVFDLEVPLADVAEAYAAMDERRAIKSLIRP